MIAKLIAHAPSRNAALDKLAQALDRTVAVGPRTNLTLLSSLCRASEFRDGRFDTGFIDRNPDFVGPAEPDLAAIALGARRLLAREVARVAENADRGPDAPASPWDAVDGFQLSGARSIVWPIVVDGEPVEARVSYGDGAETVTVSGTAPATEAVVIEADDAVYILRHGRQTVVRMPTADSDEFDHGGGDGQIRAPMHGKVLALLVGEGDRVEKGQRLAVIEAMKMEHALTARHAGRVIGLAVAAGSQVVEGTRLMTIEAEPAA